jgi:hypothetical protein
LIVSTSTAQRDLLGRFLRLAEFGGTIPYEDLYQTAGGKAVERESFIRSVVRRGYVEISDDGTVILTSHGRQASRRLMHGAGM